jgi:zinc transporter ZupT
MELFTGTILVSLVMALGCALPLLSPWARRHSVTCLLFGTGAMLGLCVFALLPEVVEAGGPRTLWLVAIAGALYSGLHLFHLGHHHHDQEEEARAVGVLLGSMSLHCFADGVVLAVSLTLSANLARAVFVAIVAHKFYEAFSVSMLLREMARSRRHFACFISVYALSFPLGIFAGWLLPQALAGAPVIIMSFALGGLLGCLWHDFLMPCLPRLQERRMQAGWLLLGFFLSALLRGGA